MVLKKSLNKPSLLSFCCWFGLVLVLVCCCCYNLGRLTSWHIQKLFREGITLCCSLTTILGSTSTTPSMHLFVLPVIFFPECSQWDVTRMSKIYGLRRILDSKYCIGSNCSGWHSQLDYLKVMWTYKCAYTLNFSKCWSPYYKNGIAAYG